jgi:hypothetical protein
MNNEINIINFIENIRDMNDDMFIDWFMNNCLCVNNYDNEQIENDIFHECTKNISNIEYKMIEHLRGDYVDISTIYDELYKITVQYKTDFISKIKYKMIDALQQQYNIYIIDYTNHGYYKAKSKIIVTLIETGIQESVSDRFKIFKKYKFIKTLQKNDNVQFNYGDIISFDIYENNHIGWKINGVDFRILIIDSVKKLIF